MSIRGLPSGRWVVNLNGYYLGSYPDREAAESEEARMKPVFITVEQEAVEHAIEGAMFVTTAEALEKKSQELNLELRKLEDRNV